MKHPERGFTATMVHTVTTLYTMKSLNILRYDSPLGPMTLAASDQGLCGVWFDDQKHGPSDTDRQHWQTHAGDPLLQAAATQLQAYFDRQRQVFDLQLDLSAGTPFQQSVWRSLLGIPSHHTQTYGDLARQLGKPQAVRAVGTAVGRNPVSIIVPCHRILGAGGQLTGYAGGLWRKQALLKLEGHPDL